MMNYLRRDLQFVYPLTTHCLVSQRRPEYRPHKSEYRLYISKDLDLI